MVDAWNSLHGALLELVRSTPIKQRLIAAYRRHLTLIKEDQLPPEARAAFAQVMRTLAGVQPLPGEDAVAASVRKMSLQEADDCATVVVEMFGMAARALEGGGAMRQAGTVVQLRSVEATSPTADFETSVLLASH